MGNVWLCSDWHFGHDQRFIYEPRGFINLTDMENTIIQKHNALVGPDDDVYVLGDLMLGDNDHGIELINQLNGYKHIVFGNHDTDTRKKLYETKVYGVVEMDHVLVFKYRKYNFYCSHFPTLTGNLEKESLHQCTLNLFGHTHDKNLFYNDMPFMYNVAMEAHKCAPVHIDKIIFDMKQKVEECKAFL